MSNNKTATHVKRSSHGGGVSTMVMTPHDSIIQLQQTIGNQAVQRLMRYNARNDTKKIGIQTKLKVSQPGDVYEQEADRVAEQIMRISVSHTSSMASKQEKQIDRKCLPCEMKKMEDEKPMKIMRKELQPSFDTMGAPDIPEIMIDKINNLRSSGGSPLDESARGFMESRFGHDFGDVRVHTDSSAAETAREVNALAYTIGHDIVFGAGQYKPHVKSGQHLLAHELTHVVQQVQGHSKLQRRLVVGGRPYASLGVHPVLTPAVGKMTAVLESWAGVPPVITMYHASILADLEEFVKHMPKPMKDEFFNLLHDPAMLEFVERMNNHGRPPDYIFGSYEHLVSEMRIRSQAIKGIAEAHNECCDYPDTQHRSNLDTTYWDKMGFMDFKPKSPLPHGKNASDAIEAIFVPKGFHTRLDCFSMTVAVEYYSMLKGIGKDRFNAMFPGGVGIRIYNKPEGLPLLSAGDEGKYEFRYGITRDTLLPGDWVYFQNFKDYVTRHQGGFWQGESAIYLGGGMYRGFGLKPMTERDLNQRLVLEYNKGLLPKDQKKGVADLIADGGGLLLDKIIRPKMSNIVASPAPVKPHSIPSPGSRKP